MPEAPRSTSSAAWWIHAGVLAALAVWHVVTFWRFWTGGASFGESLGGAILIVVIGAHAAVTTVLMVFLRRRWWTPLILHGLGIGGFLVFVTIEGADRRALEEERARIEAGDAR